LRVASGPRQLSLFKGKRQTGVAPQPPLEFKTQCALSDTLKLCCTPGWWWTALPFGEKRTPQTAGRLKRMGVKGGLPDFMFLHDLGSTAWLELKRGRLGKLSDDQERMHSFLARRGDIVLLARSYEEAVLALKDVGILPKSLKV
jgi:hypothetical protein